VAADWDGDGIDNLGFFVADQFHLSLNNNVTAGDNLNNADLLVDFPEFDFGGLDPQPVAHDFDQDGDGDIGLFVIRETGSNIGAREAGEWFLDVNTDLSGTGTIIAEFEPPPTGQPGVAFVNQDIFFNFGDEREPSALGGLLPIVGNFDPPTTTTVPNLILTNPVNPLDVNNDDVISPLDALLIINMLDSDVHGQQFDDAGTYLDVSGDGIVSPIDALLVINALHPQLPRAAAAAVMGKSSDADLNLPVMVIDIGLASDPTNELTSEASSRNNDAGIETSSTVRHRARLLALEEYNADRFRSGNGTNDEPRTDISEPSSRLDEELLDVLANSW
jgi:hypothetical protein